MSALVNEPDTARLLGSRPDVDKPDGAVRELHGPTRCPVRAYAGWMQPWHGRGIDWDGHVLLIHASEPERRAGVVSWVRRGLESDSRIVYLEAADEPADRSLLGVLATHHVDVTRAVDRGQLQVVDPAVGVGSAWQTALVEEGLRAGYPAVRLAGEARTSWQVMQLEDHADAERMADELCRSRPVSILCQYPSDAEASILEKACAMHGAGVRGAKLLTVPLPDGVAVAGEIDVSNVRIVRSAVAAACGADPEGHPTVVVDLTRLSFIDVAGARALLTATAAHRDQGGVVWLRDAQPTVDRLLRQLGVDTFAGVTLKDRL